MIINGDKEYKQDEFVHFIREYTGKVRDVETKKGNRKYKEYTMREIPFNDIVAINLNKRGESIPFTSNGVINVNRYLFWYWTPIIGADVVSLYTLLTEYCDDETDILYPKQTELAERLGISRVTIATKLQELEDNNFIIKVARLNKLANMKQTSPIYKIRQTIPLLSKEQYNMLPDYLQKKHDQFMEKYGSENAMDYFSYDASETKDSLLTNSEKIISKKDREKIKNILENSQHSEYIMVNLTESQIMYSERFREALQPTRGSSPTLQLAFGDSIVIYDDSIKSAVLIGNDYCKDLANNMSVYRERICSAMSEVFDDNITDFDIYTFKDYIYSMERLK